MKDKQMYKLNVGDKITHKHYGVCTVTGHIPEFGVLILPDTDTGKHLLHQHFGQPLGTELLETSGRHISALAIADEILRQAAEIEAKS